MINVPKTVFKLKDIDICQCGNQNGSAKDILTWIDHFFENENDRKTVMKTLAAEAEVRSHDLLKWNDTTSKEKVAKIFNKTISKLKKGYHADH